MSSTKLSDWRIVMLIDGTDASGKLTYQHVYQHRDGRKAYVGPGYCSDPDLEWILFIKNRERKAWEITYTRRGKIGFYINLAASLIVLIQAALAFPEKGAWVILSILGYWATQFGGVGFFNNFRDLIIRSSKFRSEKKFLHFLIVSCFIFCGHLLIGFGRLHSISILFLQVPLLWFGLFMGMINGLVQKWKAPNY